MNQQEIIKVLSILRMRYPTAKLWEQEASATGRAWAMTLADVDYTTAQCVVVDWCKRETWPPDPAEIRRRVRTQERDERTARASAALIESYRRPALGEGWMERAKRPTATHAEMTQHVVELAQAWERGEIGLDSVRAQCEGVFDAAGGLVRFVANHHARDQVRDLIGALAAEDDERAAAVVTKHGTFTPQDLREHGGILTTVNGQQRLVWPVSGTGPGSWRYKPAGGA